MTKPTAPSIDLAGQTKARAIVLRRLQPGTTGYLACRSGERMNYHKVRLDQVVDAVDDALLSAAEREQALVERVKVLEGALRPFAEVADWAERNKQDLVADYDMLLRGPGNAIAGHLHVQSEDFVAARAALANAESRDEG